MQIDRSNARRPRARSICAGIFALLLALAGAAHAAKRPNIILFIADDLGMGDVGCYDASSTIPTPHLDRLAGQGMRFTDVHTPAAVCTPTRFSVLTGRYPLRSTLDKYVLYSAYDEPLLKDPMLTLPEMLQQAGYATGGFGKWHVGCEFANRAGDGIAKPGVGTSKFTTKDVDFTKPILDGPTRHGFDYWFGLGSSINHGPYAFIENDRVTVVPDHIRPQQETNSGVFREGWIAKGWDDERIGERVCIKARDWIARQARSDKPFFMYYAEVAPHFPHVPPEDLLGTKVRHVGGQDDKNPYRTDMVVQVDVILGKLLERLDDPNGDGDKSDSLAANTLVIVTSDNGADLGYYAPLRDKKGSIWEGGHRVPFIVRYPGTVKPGAVNHAMFGLNDLYATLAGLVGQEVPDGQAQDSFDVRPVLSGQRIDRPEPLVIQRAGNSRVFAVREGSWKLIRPADNEVELYDLENDLKEASDVSAKHRKLTQRLRDYLTGTINVP